jgi:hemerythrin-like metal-binding protein
MTGIVTTTGDAVPYSQWDPSLETGSEIVDRQHRQLYDLINELHDSIVENHDRELQDDVLVRLMRYAELHFDDEENLMRSVGYPALADQRRMHGEFKAEAARLTETYRAGEVLLPITLAIFLHDWLVKHIRIEDKKIGEFIRARAQ